MRPLRPFSAHGALPPPSRIRPLAAHIHSVCIMDLVGHDLTDHESQDCCVTAEENVRTVGLGVKLARKKGAGINCVLRCLHLQALHEAAVHVVAAGPVGVHTYKVST